MLLYSLGITVLGLKQLLPLFSAESVEDFFPGVRKSTHRHRLIRYSYLSAHVGEMTPERFLERMSESNFLGKNGFVALIRGVRKEIFFEGAGGLSYDLPHIVFSGGEAHFDVPYNLKGSREWDDVAVELAGFFNGATKAP